MNEIALLDDLRQLCHLLPEAEESTLQDRPMFHVRRRRFTIVNTSTSPARSRWDGCGASLHFLSDPAEREALRQDRRFTATPHHGDRGWLMLRIDDPTTEWREISELVTTAYRLVMPTDLPHKPDRSAESIPLSKPQD